ncbi:MULTISPECIES: HAL/PAL/TAL family ammonia-lyase [Rathayibacter]|uniref:Histidine ammonia-lyase n=2 Tax=Rathayibacter festucae TaxID=110937 RepID=A0A3Q9V1F7_9MICO|nr:MULTISPECIES: histidine ammonia-lyase [Rathayibacter]AZZ53286.1 histidine ammonia-lyase [Rathayibacter festucae DSM 15932]MCJ1698120.1 histidine ammonia-lyase [Rathayibacter festucae]NRG42016.1 histidine ammonia-lyase [Rathayibacter sp. VKM Ac-2835]QHC61401.1 aromatic amino acid lyase [Rathayibacter festucae]TCL82261.1 histidine ammonia-lyase [Rathayibacter sp. PhB192]
MTELAQAVVDTAAADTAVVEIDGFTLTIEDVALVARGLPDGSFPHVVLSDEARRVTNEARAYVDEHFLAPDAPAIYGINTGLGRLMDVRVPAADQARFQRLVINSHSAGVGEPLPLDETRALLLLRTNAIAKGMSGVRIECIDRLIAMLNADVLPVIPGQGSVGASGDLAPLAHMVSVMVGHEKAEAYHRGVRMPAVEALAAAGLEIEFDLKPKDVLALINGSTISLATACLALHDAWSLTRQADVALALSLEAVRGELDAFDERIHLARNAPGQVDVAANVRALTAGSERTVEDARRIQLPDEHRAGPYKPRVQDAYSLRCAPQVHGTTRESLLFAETLLVREANAATDNPLVLPDGQGGYDVLSGGNFHGEPIGVAADLISIAVAEIGAISERRSFRLTDPNLSYGLPLNLVGGQLGLNTGFSIVHCAAAAIASENKVLCFPSVVDSIPTKANQEDHVSMCTFSSRKARSIIKNTQVILGVEFILATQGIDLAAPHLDGRALGEGSAAAYEAVRSIVPMTREDIYQSEQMMNAQAMVVLGTVLSAVESRIGVVR